MDLACALFVHRNRIRQIQPLILNITNYVAMDFCANALLALGASPIMSMACEEVEELAVAADAVVVNMGTLDEQWVRVAKRAWIAAREKKKPVVFDPAGAGATRYRTRVARELLMELGAAVVRGNASEILALSTGQNTSKGVDSTRSTESVIELAKAVAIENDTVVVVSGETDYIVDSNKVRWFRGGSPLMRDVTAMGCVSSCLVAAFRAVELDVSVAALRAMMLMGICAEGAARQSRGPASLKTAFVNALAAEDFELGETLRVGTL